jgi:hypothetical protein
MVGVTELHGFEEALAAVHQYIFLFGWKTNQSGYYDCIARNDTHQRVI